MYKLKILTMQDTETLEEEQGYPFNFEVVENIILKHVENELKLLFDKMQKHCTIKCGSNNCAKQKINDCEYEKCDFETCIFTPVVISQFKPITPNKGKEGGK